MSASDVQRAPIVYGEGVNYAALPDEVDQSLCDHEIGICYCVHDWRINWGNVSRAPKPKATYIQ